MDSADLAFSDTWNSLEDCRQFALRLSRILETPMTLRLDGTLGAGKTQFTKFLAESFGADIDDVTSPTFVLVHRYETTPVVYHLDAYRVGDEDEFLELGIEEFFEAPAITIVEWGEKFVSILPKDHLSVELEVKSEDSRTIKLRGTGPRSQAIVAKLREETS